MKKLISASMIAGALALGAGSVTAEAANATSVAVFSSQKVMAEIPQAKAAQKKLESEFAARGKEVEKIQDQLKATVEKLQKNGANMNATERTNTERKAQELEAQLQIKGRALQEDQRNRLGQEIGKLEDKVFMAVEKLAKQKGYAMVLDASRGGVWYAEDSVDITKEVIELVGKSN